MSKNVESEFNVSSNEDVADSSFILCMTTIFKNLTINT